MIENVKRFVNEHRTLMVVIVGVLVICFIFWWFCCKDRSLVSKVRGGRKADYKDMVCYNEKKGFVCRCIGKKTKGFYDEETKKTYNLIVLNKEGFEVLKKLVREADIYYLSYLDNFCNLNYDYGKKGTKIIVDYSKKDEIGLWELIRDPIKMFGALLRKTELCYPEDEVDEFDFEKILGKIQEKKKREILKSYSGLMNVVVKEFDCCFDEVSYVGQLGKKKLANDYNDYIKNDGLLYSPSLEGLVESRRIKLIYDNFVADEDNIRKWYKSEGVTKKFIKGGYYYNEMNGNIVNLLDADEHTFLKKTYTAIDGFGEIINDEGLNGDNSDFSSELEKMIKCIDDINESLSNKRIVKKKERREAISVGREIVCTVQSFSTVNFDATMKKIAGNKGFEIDWKNLVGKVNSVQRFTIPPYQVKSKKKGRKKAVKEGEENEEEKETMSEEEYVKFTYMKKLGGDLGNSCNKFDVADIYPACKLALTILFFMLVYPKFSSSTQRNVYLGMIASYVLYVNSFNTFCNVRMESEWNRNIKNEYVYKKIEKEIKINVRDLINPEKQIMILDESVLLKMQFESTINHYKFLEKRLGKKDILKKLEEEVRKYNGGQNSGILTDEYMRDLVLNSGIGDEYSKFAELRKCKSRALVLDYEACIAYEMENRKITNKKKRDLLRFIYHYIDEKIGNQVNIEAMKNYSEASDSEIEEGLKKLGIQMGKEIDSGEDDDDKDNEEEKNEVAENEAEVKEKNAAWFAVNEAIERLKVGRREREEEIRKTKFVIPNNDDERITSNDVQDSSGLNLDSVEIKKKSFLERSKNFGLSVYSSAKHCFDYIFSSDK